MSRRRLSRKQMILSAIILVALPGGLIQTAHSQSVGESNPPQHTLQRRIDMQTMQRRIESERGMIAGYERKRSQLEQDLAEFQEELFDVESQREQILQEQFDNGVSNESFADIMRSLQLQRVELSIDLAGLDARRKSLQAIAEASPATAAQANIQAKLQQQVDILKQAVEFAKQRHQNGVGPESELFAAQRNLLTAEIRLLETRQVESTDPGSIELRDVALERAEKRARLEKVEEILGQLATARVQIGKVGKLDRQGEMWRDKIEMANQSFRDVSRKIDVARQRLENYLEIQEEQAAEDN